VSRLGFIPTSGPGMLLQHVSADTRSSHQEIDRRVMFS